jgi:anti-sigma factor RsiW
MAPGPKVNDNDAVLVTYLDGELKPEVRQELERRLRIDASLRARLAALAEGGQQLRSSFDALLEAAPRARLDAAFAAALARVPRRRKYRYREMLLAAAAAILLLICGGVAGYFIAKAPGELFEEADAFEEEWIAAVAGQLSLYNAASVDSIKVDEAEQRAQLNKLRDVLNLDLSAPKVELEGLTLKRAELLHFQGRKVAELLYASEHGPVALCIVAEPGGEGEGEVESRDGLNFIYWAASGRRFLLIGAAPEERIDALAATIASRLGS